MTRMPTSRIRTNIWLRSCLHVCLSGVLLAPLSACAETKLLKPIHESQSLIIENNDLSGLDFFATYSSKNVNERRLAEMYLLGVMDATEGKGWCSYKAFKTITIDEAIYTGFKKLDKSQLEVRASTIINQILSSKFRCGAPQ